MKKRKHITPEMIAKLSPEERKEFLLLLEAESRPKLLRIYQPSSPQPFDHDDLRTALEAGIKRSQANPEERAAEEAQRAKDEADWLAWYDARGGKDDDSHPIVRALIRVARSNRGDFDGASEAQIEAEKARAAAKAAKSKPADPVPEVIEERDEVPRQPVIQRERPPQSIFDALDRPTRDPMQIGESFGSWRR
jgi:hypothetical protein